MLGIRIGNKYRVHVLEDFQHNWDLGCFSLHGQWFGFTLISRTTVFVGGRCCPHALNAPRLPAWENTLAQLSLSQPKIEPPKQSKNMLRWIAETAVHEYKALQKPAELASFLALLLELRPRIMVEIGCDAGGTLWAWKQAGVPRVIGIEYPDEHPDDDPWGTDNPLVPHGAEIIRGDSHEEATRYELKELLAGEPIDVLFIDADHTYEGVKKDFIMYSPMVANEGAIVFHDVSPHPNHPDVGVQKLWEKCGGDKDEILLPPLTWGGIGVVRQWRDSMPAVVTR